MVNSEQGMLMLNLLNLPLIFQNVKHVWEEKTRKTKKQTSQHLNETMARFRVITR